uniref:Reverse transcriptase zinc-binding domain-containing protein n=1 Tax=Cannabis sativa TaxID=3483 RepID=A0A803PK91_CANSA
MVLQIPIDPNPVDSLIWGFHQSGIITINSAYHLASAAANVTSPSSSDPNPFKIWWKTLWTLPIPPKIKHFTWKAFNHNLPCALNLFHKKVLNEPFCHFCGGDPESVTHVLIDCTRARRVWKHSKFKNFHNDHRRVYIKEFYLQGIHLIPKEDLPLFQPINEFSSQSSVKCIIQEDTRALSVAAALDHDNCVTGLGFVFKIGLHRVVTSTKIHKPGASTPIFAESQAHLDGIAWCLSSQLKLEFMFTDCLNLVSKVNGHWKDQSTLSSLVLKIRHSFSNFPDASLKYFPRQFNANAHSLAKCCSEED